MNKTASIFVLICSIFICSNLATIKANTTDTLQKNTYKNSLSLNVLEPSLRMLKINNIIDSGIGLRAPIIAYGRFTKKMQYKLGFRGVFKNRINKTDIFTDKKYDQYNRADVVLAIMRRRLISPKLEFNFGPALLAFAQTDKKIFDSGFDRVTFAAEDKGAALGLNCVLYYKINSRLHLYTEYLLAYQYTSSSLRRLFTAFPQDSYTVNKENQHGFQFEYPMTIFVSYNF